MKPENNVLLLGGIIIDRYFEVEVYPAPGQDTLIRNSYDKIGGCALNVAVTLNNLGSHPFIVSKRGDDEVGEKIEQYVRSIGLSTACIRTAPGQQTGYSLTIIDPAGERTFFTHKGVEKEFSSEMIPGDLLAGLAFAYVTGYYLLSQPTAGAVLELVEGLKQTSCQVVFDPGPLAGKIEPAQLQKMIALSDWIIPNVAELAIVHQVLGFPGDPLDWLLGHGARYVAVKKGEQGVDLHTGSSTQSIQGFRVKAIDTTGAGDSFVGGLIHGLIHHFDPVQAIELANACGAYTATIQGPHGIFSAEQLAQFISTSKDQS
ncbi:MAG TPA: carbohydrate kinase family protein [Anaerolineales bacterium]